MLWGGPQSHRRPGPAATPISPGGQCDSFLGILHLLHSDVGAQLAPRCAVTRDAVVLKRWKHLDVLVWAIGSMQRSTPNRGQHLVLERRSS